MQSFAIKSKKFKQLLSVLPPVSLTDGPWIAGGAVRKLYQNKPWNLVGDVDIFFKDPTQRREWQTEFYKMHNLVSSVPICLKLETPNADTWQIGPDSEGSLDITVKLQFIKKYYADSYTELWDKFDFTVCQFAADKDTIVASDSAITDTANNELVVSNPENSKCLSLRIVKYFSYGFGISDELLLSAAEQIVNGEVEWDEQY